MDTCPNCGWEYHPRPPRPRRSRLIILVPAIVLTFCIGWIAFRAVSTGLVSRVLGLEKAPTPTLTPLVIYVVATAPPPTPTIPPTITPTPTSQFTPTPLRTGAPTSTLAAETATPPATVYPVPALTDPADRARFQGKDVPIVLAWKPVSASLSENEWYRISVTFTGRDGKPAERIGWAKEPRWEMVPDWWNEILPGARTVTWNVTVVRVDNVDPFASPTFVRISKVSASRTFTWE